MHGPPACTASHPFWSLFFLLLRGAMIQLSKLNRACIATCGSCSRKASTTGMRASRETSGGGEEAWSALTE